MIPSSPPSKRIKLEAPKIHAEEEIEGGNNCSICLQEISDQTILPICSHEFCFECLLIWTKQSRRCPLCSRGIGEYLIHNVRSKHDFSKHYLAPLRSSPVLQNPLNSVADFNTQAVFNSRRRSFRQRERDRRQREELNEVDRLQQSIGKRRWVYRHGLYAKHVASNAFTRYKPYPSPAQFSMSLDLISRTTSFVRRELQVWPNLDVEFLTTFTISIMKSIDIRSESAVKLLAEFLDMDSSYVEGGRHVNAEHFAHEIYSFVRSPYRDVFVYDDIVQYDIPLDTPPPPTFHHRRRWRRNSPSRSRSHTIVSFSGSDSQSPSRSPSRSASLRNFSPLTHHESDEPLYPPSPSRLVNDNRHGFTESAQSPLSACEIGSPRHQDIASPNHTEQRNEGETGEESNSSELDNKRSHGEQSEHPLVGLHVVDGKGKQRTHDTQGKKENNVVQREPSKHEIKMQHEGNLDSLPLFSAQSKVIERKPPRNRSLRECVETHLRSRKRKSSKGDCEDMMDLDDKEDQVHISGNDNVASTASCHNFQNDKQGANSVNETVDGNATDVSHASPRPEYRIISPWDIVTDTAIETSTQDVVPNQDSVISTDIDHMGKGRSNHVIGHAADHDIHPVRSRLLLRLKEEKAYAYAEVAGGSACPPVQRQVGDAAVNHHMVDSLAVEADLRKRARLQMKLATEKRAITSG